MSSRNAAERIPADERGHLLLELYSVLDGMDRTPGYREIHGLVRELQGKMEDEYGATFGYEFGRESFDGPWDPELQSDLEVLGLAGLTSSGDSKEGPRLSKLGEDYLGLASHVRAEPKEEFTDMVRETVG